MAFGFKWKLGSYVGGSTAVHQAYKPYLVLSTPGHDQQAVGEITVQPRDFSDITISGLGFSPTAIVLVSFRPRNHNLSTDTNFGNRGGGMTYGIGGYASSTTVPWDDATAYSPGDQVIHDGEQYVSNSIHTNSEPPSADWDSPGLAQFTGSTRIRQGFDMGGARGIKRWREDSCLNVISVITGTRTLINILTLSLASLNADGFTLSVDENLYDQTDPVFWLAIGGANSVGVIDAGTTSIGGFAGTPSGALFLSTKSKTSDLGSAAATGAEKDNWDHMQGFAAPNSQAVIWGGGREASWGHTTERWEDDASILFCLPALSSGFAGASVIQRAIVSGWGAGGIDLSWPLFDNVQYRIGYLLSETGEAGVIETSWETRPEGSFVGADGANFVPTNIVPDVVLMGATNYTFSFSNADPYDQPRSPDQFGSGGSGGLGFHAAPFSELGDDAYGVHTYGNAVQETGHYSNSATFIGRRYIMPGAGANSNPPAQHQHSVNIIPNPVIVGTNYRYAERHSHVKRIHINQSDRPLGL